MTTSWDVATEFCRKRKHLLHCRWERILGDTAKGTLKIYIVLDTIGDKNFSSTMREALRLPSLFTDTRLKAITSASFFRPSRKSSSRKETEKETSNLIIP